MIWWARGKSRWCRFSAVGLWEREAWGVQLWDASAGWWTSLRVSCAKQSHVLLLIHPTISSAGVIVMWPPLWGMWPPASCVLAGRECPQWGEICSLRCVVARTRSAAVQLWKVEVGLTRPALQVPCSVTGGTAAWGWKGDPDSSRPQS